MKKQLATAALALGVAAAGTLSTAQDNSDDVVLINTLTVPADALDTSIELWEIARDFLDDQPGYISTQLHQSLSPDASFQLINVAKWESADAFTAATAALQQAGILPRVEGLNPNPALYSVIRD